MLLAYDGEILYSTEKASDGAMLQRDDDIRYLVEISLAERWKSFPVPLRLVDVATDLAEVVPIDTMPAWHVPGISGSCIWFRDRETPTTLSIIDPITVPVDLDNLHLFCDLGCHRAIVDLVVRIEAPSGDTATLRHRLSNSQMGGRTIEEFQNIQIELGAIAEGSTLRFDVEFLECTSIESSFNPCILVCRPRLLAEPGDAAGTLTPLVLEADDHDGSFFAATLPDSWRQGPADVSFVQGTRRQPLCPEQALKTEFKLTQALQLEVSSDISLSVTVWSHNRPPRLQTCFAKEMLTLRLDPAVATLRDISGTFIFWVDVLDIPPAKIGAKPAPPPTKGPQRFRHDLRAQDLLATHLVRRTVQATSVQISAVETERRLVAYVCLPAPRPVALLDPITVKVGDVEHEMVFTPLPSTASETVQAASVYRANLPCLFGEGRAKVSVHVKDVLVYEGHLDLDSVFDGRIEKYSNGQLRGWAIDFRNPEAPVAIDLKLNGLLYTSGRADTLRRDVEANYPSFARAGFSLAVTPQMLGQTHLMPEVYVSDQNLPLQSKVGMIEELGELRKPSAVPQRLFDPTPVTIIVPIYNAGEDVAVCVASVLRHTALSAQPNGNHLILANDASPDPDIRPLLDGYADIPGVTILHQPENLGYTANINAAMSICSGRDVVLLNSDTQVTPQWLSLLQRAARQRSSIGTVTAVSDNAGAFSVPSRNAANPLPPWLERDDFARQVTHSSQLEHFRVPTGSGFCMYIAAGMIRDIGLFDEVNFPRGYGEENDFCMRGLHAGWEHVIADNVMIYHERSKSFLGEKETLIEKANQLVPEMYPEYEKAVGQAFVSNQPIKAMRYRVASDRLRAPKIALPRIAFVIGVDSGGTPQTNMDLMSRIQDDYAPFLLLCTTSQLIVFEIIGNQRHEVETIALDSPVEPISHDSPAYRAAIADILQRYGFELVHIRHIGRHGLSLISTAKSLDIPVIFSLHDFYTVCPNVKLLDAENQYCGGTCTSDNGKDCNVELWRTGATPPLKNHWIKSWKRIFQRILNDCDRLITTSPFARDLIKSHHGLDDVPFDVIPHARDFKRMERLGRPPLSGEPLRVFIPGHLAPAKGLDLIKEIVALDMHGEIEFHFAGISPEDLSPYGVSHGRYNRDQIETLIRKIDPHIGGVLAIWPETYSHTVTELWASGLPVVTTQLGATGERIAKHGGGWALEDMSADAVYAHLRSLIHNPHEIDRRAREVYDWQAGYGHDYSGKIMAERYKSIYRQTMAGRKAAPRQAEVRLVSVGRKYNEVLPGTEHLTPVLNRLVGDHHLSVWPTGYLNLFDEIEAPDGLVIRYQGPVAQAHDFAECLQGLPTCRIVVDISPDCPPSAWEAETMDSGLAYLLKRADEVVAPSAFLDTERRASQLDMSPAFATRAAHEGYLNKIAKRAPPAIPALPVPATPIGATHAARLDREVLPGCSQFVTSHNALLVDAHFSLIDWRGMLTRPRVPRMVSIIVPAYDRVAITQNMVASVLKNAPQGRAIEIIVIDNGSKVEAGRELRQLSQVDPRVRLVRSDMPLMFSVGCNYGASFAQGEFVLFMNNDMLVCNPDWLSQIIRPLESQTSIGITGSRLLYQDKTIQHAGIAFNAASKFPYHIHKDLPGDSACVMKDRDMTAVTGACLAIRASDWAKLRGFSPLYVNGSEDIDLCLRMQKVLTRTVRYVAAPEIIHLEGKSPGRGQANIQNRRVFLGLWGDAVAPDDARFYAQDKVAMPTFISIDHALNSEYRSIQAVTKTLAPVA